MNTILFALKLMILTGNSTVYVDRVESDYGYQAVICAGTDCTTVLPTVAPSAGGLHEGQKVTTCETVGPRLDGTRVEICNGSVAAFIRADGSRLANPYFAGVR
jgi:hypothetical protein